MGFAPVEDAVGSAVRVRRTQQGDRLAVEVDGGSLEIGLGLKLDDVTVRGGAERGIDRGEVAAARANGNRVGEC